MTVKASVETRKLSWTTSFIHYIWNLKTLKNKPWNLDYRKSDPVKGSLNSRPIMLKWITFTHSLRFLIFVTYPTLLSIVGKRKFVNCCVFSIDFSWLSKVVCYTGSFQIYIWIGCLICVFLHLNEIMEGLFFYNSTQSWRSYIFTPVCLSVCLSVCVSRFLVSKIPAERMHWFGHGFR